MAGEQLVQRLARLIIAVPVSTPGDYTHVTRDVFEFNVGDKASDPANRVQFKIGKNLEKEPNTSEIIVTNLSPKTRARIQEKGSKITLFAGYKEVGMSKIFDGDVRTADQVREGASWLTKIRVGDGERSYRFAHASESFAPGTGAGDIIKFLANASGLALGNIPTDVINIGFSFDQGYAVHGLVSRELDRVVKAIPGGYTVSVQDGALQLLRVGSSLEASVPQDDTDSGLIGSPEMGTPDKKGKPALVKYKRLLTPVLPGSRRKLVSERYNGFVRVKKCNFDGDTYQGPWDVEIEGVIDG